jgi:16S rRNA processing protein RimM
LVRFAECDGPETAKPLTGSTLYVDRAEMPDLEDGEYYHADLPGCRVVDESGQCLGRVEDVFASGAHDILVVASGGREWMLPVVPEYVISMEVGRDTIVARVPEGLRG